MNYYFNKYKKYKLKYLNLKKYGGGANKTILFNKINDYLSNVITDNMLPSDCTNYKNPFENIKTISEGANGETLSADIDIEDYDKISIALKKIPLTKKEFENRGNTLYKPWLELDILYKSNELIINNINPHFNITYYHFLCGYCNYDSDKLLKNKKYDFIENLNDDIIKLILEDKDIKESYNKSLRYEYKNFNTWIRDTRPKLKFILQYNKLNPANKINLPCLYIINELADGTLKDILDDILKNNLDELLSDTLNYTIILILIGLFQIFTGLLCFQQLYKITHNDFHYKNILYTKYDKDDKFDNYIINENEFLIPRLGFTFKIWDWGEARTIPDKTNEYKDYRYISTEILSEISELTKGKENSIIIKILNQIILFSEEKKPIIDCIKYLYKNINLFSPYSKDITINDTFILKKIE